MTIQIVLKTSEPHCVLMYAENDAEKKLLQIFKGDYKAEVTPTFEESGQYFVRDQLPNGVRIELRSAPPKETP